jgi:bifunctional non-homologous end joining protein LigD
MAKKKASIDVEGHSISLSNLDKLIYPHFNKAQVIDYYIHIADYLLPHVKNRPVTLKRFPDGVGGKFFYEKDAPRFTPDWVETFPVPRRTGRRDIRYILINNLATLVWLSTLANLEIHPFLHRAPHIDRPTYVVFDLDPGDGADILSCCRVAMIVHETLKQMKLQSFVKVSGSKGLQLYVPLNTATNYGATAGFAKTLAEVLEQQHPALIVSSMDKARRRRKVFIDWSQNSDFKTTVSVYSLRAKTDTPYVSLPVEWVEIQTALDAEDSKQLYFTPAIALERLAKTGDLFHPVLTLKQKLPSAVDTSLRKTKKTPRAAVL